MIIYKITNLINNKIYIGQTTRSLNTRFSEHCQDTDKLLIHRAIKKYGKNNFKIEQIDTADTIEELGDKETLWIKHYNSTNKSIGYNITEGGFNPPMPFDSIVKRVSKRIKNKKELGKNVGVWFDKTRKRWSFEINFSEKTFCQKNFKSKKDAQIARDIKLLDLFKPNIAIQMMAFPENIDKYISGLIKYPKRVLYRKLKKSTYLWVNFESKINLWSARINIQNKRNSKNNIIKLRKGMFRNEVEAAEMADFLNLKINGSDFNLLNFPEKKDIFLSVNYVPPKSCIEKTKKCKYKYVFLDKKTGSIYVDLRDFNMKRKFGFKSEEEAKQYRDNILKENNLSIPNEFSNSKYWP